MIYKNIRSDIVKGLIYICLFFRVLLTITIITKFELNKENLLKLSASCLSIILLLMLLSL